MYENFSAGVLSFANCHIAFIICVYCWPENYYKVLRMLCKPSSFSLLTNNYFISSITFAVDTTDFFKLIFRRIFVVLRRRRYPFVSPSNVSVKSSKTNAQNIYYLVFIQHAVYTNLNNDFFFRNFQLFCSRFFSGHQHPDPQL